MLKLDFCGPWRTSQGDHLQLFARLIFNTHTNVQQTHNSSTASTWTLEVCQITQFSPLTFKGYLNLIVCAF